MNKYFSIIKEISDNYRDFPPRDPMPDFHFYENELNFLYKNILLKNLEVLKLEFDIDFLSDVQKKLSYTHNCILHVSEFCCTSYSSGVPFDLLEDYINNSVFFAKEIVLFYIKYYAEYLQQPEDNVSGKILDARRLGGELRFISLIFFIARDSVSLNNWMQFVRDGESGSYVIDILIKAFYPSWVIQKKYNKLEIYHRPNLLISLQKALSAPDKVGKEAALAQYMERWNHRMKPYGWKPERKYTWLDRSKPRPADCDDGFYEFAYEVALAVCAWDLDDSAFRDHPYYPRDLVDYYRAHVRHTRDAWRPEGVGAGIAVMAPPQPKKIDLHKSKAKGYKRWLELTCDGDKNACTDTLEALGTLRSLKNSWDEVFDQLSGNGHAVRADLKDPDTLQAQIDALATQRPLAEFTPPDDPPAGPARCEMLMQQAPAWAAAQGYTWQALDDGGDNWQAVLIRSEFHAEWLALSAALHLPPGLLG